MWVIYWTTRTAGHLIYVGRNSWNRTMNGKHIPHQVNLLSLLRHFRSSFFLFEIRYFPNSPHPSSSSFREFVQGIVSRRSERMTLAVIQCLPPPHPVHPPSGPPRWVYWIAASAWPPVRVCPRSRSSSTRTPSTWRRSKGKTVVDRGSCRLIRWVSGRLLKQIADIGRASHVKSV